MFLPEIKEMILAGKTQREIAEYFGLIDKCVVKKILNRERRKADRIAAASSVNNKRNVTRLKDNSVYVKTGKLL